jgi:hypothetical protein
MDQRETSMTSPLVQVVMLAIARMGWGLSAVLMLSPQQDAWKYTILYNNWGLYHADIRIDAVGNLCVAVAYPH